MTSEAGTRTAFGAPAPSDAVLRAVAHEIRQPLSTIESLAYYLGLVVPRQDDKVHEQLARLQQLVEQSNWILSSGLHLVDALEIAPELIDIEELITQSVVARGSGGISVALDLPGNLPPVRLDPNLARALFANLLILFRQVSKDTYPLSLRLSAASGGRVSLEFFTPAPGYRSEAMLGPGSTLSLDCARRIIEAHGGSLSIEIDPVRGIRLSLTF
jgi:two-component system, OmpR family, sensor histidine kinase KdpD